MWPLKTIFYFSMFWLGCLAALFNPIWGVANYMMAYQAHPPYYWWGRPLVELGMRFSLLAVIFTILGLFLARRRVPECRPMFSGWELGVFLLLAIAALNTVFGVDYGPFARYAFEKFWKLQVFVLILARLAITRRNLFVVIWSIVAGSFYLGYDALTASPDKFLLGRLESFGGPDIATSSGAAAHLTAMLPIIGIAFLAASRWKWKAMAAAAGGLAVNAIILCRTRSAFIGLMVGAVVAVLMAPRARRFRIHLLLIVAAGVGISQTDSYYWERMKSLFQSELLTTDQAVTSRVDIWKASARMLSDYPMGVGLGNFSRMIERYDPRYRHRSPHNTFIMCVCELGILGGIVFLYILFESLRLLYRSTRLAHLTERPLETKFMVYGMLVSLCSYVVAGLGTERFSCESYWWIMVFPLCLHRMVVQEVRAPAEASATVPNLANVRSSMEALVYGP